MDTENMLTDSLRTKIWHRSLRLLIMRAVELFCAGTILWNLGSLLRH